MTGPGTVVCAAMPLPNTEPTERYVSPGLTANVKPNSPESPGIGTSATSDPSGARTASATDSAAIGCGSMTTIESAGVVYCTFATCSVVLVTRRTWMNGRGGPGCVTVGTFPHAAARVPATHTARMGEPRALH